MGRKPRDVELRETTSLAIEYGLPPRHAQVLAKICQRKNLHTRVQKVMMLRDYRDLIESYKEMVADPSTFHQKHRARRIADFNEIVTDGTLSREYSMASPTNIVREILKAAEWSRKLEKYRSTR